MKEEGQRTFAQLCFRMDPRLTMASIHKHPEDLKNTHCHLLCLKSHPADCDAVLKDDNATWCTYCGQQVDSDGTTYQDQFHKHKHFPEMARRSTDGFIEWKGVFYFTSMTTKNGKSVSSLVCVSDVKPYGFCYLRQLHTDMWIQMYGNIRPENPLAPSKFDFLELCSSLPVDNEPEIETGANGIKSFILTQSLYKLAIEDVYVKAVLIAASTRAAKGVAFQAVVNPPVNSTSNATKKRKKKKKKSAENPKQRDVSLSSLAGKVRNNQIKVPLRHLAITKLANELAKLLDWKLDFTSYTAMYHNTSVPFHADSPAIGEKFIIIKLSEDSIPVEFDPNHIEENLRGDLCDLFTFVPKPWSLYVVEDHLRFAAHKVESNECRAVLRLGYGNLDGKQWFANTVCDDICKCWHK